MENAIALVAGGSSGVGLACAELLAGRGLSVVIVARRTKTLELAQQELWGKGLKVHGISADLRDPDEIHRLHVEIGKTGRQVRWLLNAVGIGHYDDLSNSSESDIDAVVRTNLIAPIYTTRAFLDQIIATKGVICNLSSRAALRGIAGESIYCATKWGLRGFTDALREEIASKGVRVIGVYPGPIATAFWKPWRDRLARNDWHTFMEPGAVASEIVRAMIDTPTLTVTDLIIGRAPAS